MIKSFASSLCGIPRRAVGVQRALSGAKQSAASAAPLLVVPVELVSDTL